MRRALGDDARDPRFLETLRGRGFRFVAEVHEESDRSRTVAPSDVLVGRESTLRDLSDDVARAVDGSGGIVVLSGDAGIGKSRVADALLSRCNGSAVGVGWCYEGEGTPPFWPWSQALRELLRRIDSESLAEIPRDTSPCSHWPTPKPVAWLGT